MILKVFFNFPSRCQLVNGTEAWWRRIFRSFYNSDNWFNISRLTSYQEALNVLKKVSTSAKQVQKSSLQLLHLPFQYDKLCCIREGLLYYIQQDQILSRSLADLSESPTFICGHPKAWPLTSQSITDVIVLKENIIALQVLRDTTQSTAFVNKEGVDDLEIAATVCYCKDFILLS